MVIGNNLKKTKNPAKSQLYEFHYLWVLSYSYLFGQESVGPDNIPGYDKIQALASYLVTLRFHTYLSTFEVHKLEGLWNALHEHDKARVIYHSRHQIRQVAGRFRVSKTTVAPGVDSVRRLADFFVPFLILNGIYYTSVICSH